MNSSLQDRLASRLGGALGMPTAVDEMSLARTDRKQLGGMLLRTLVGEHLLAPADVYRIVPRRTWIRRKNEGLLTNSEFDGLYRMLRLQLLAELVFWDAQRAHDWLHTPKKRLDGMAPMDFASDVLGVEAVENWLHEIDQGYFA